MVVGSALLSLCMDVMFEDQPFAVVENVIVESTCRNLGVGAVLLRKVENIARDRHCSKIMLLSSASRDDAHRFFARHGYQERSKRGFVKYRREFNTAL